MGHFLEIFLQLLGFFPPWRMNSDRSDSQMARIGNFFGMLFYVGLALLTLGVLIAHFLL